MNPPAYRYADTKIYPLDDQRVIILFLNSDDNAYEPFGFVEAGIFRLGPTKEEAYYTKIMRICHETNSMTSLRTVGLVVSVPRKCLI